MLVDRVFCFWLGATDSHVATGGDSGGTRDIRFCKVADQVTEFIGKPPSRGRWRIELQAYPEYGLSGFPLEIARTTTVARLPLPVVRNGWCGTTGRHGGRKVLLRGSPHCGIR